MGVSPPSHGYLNRENDDRPDDFFGYPIFRHSLAILWHYSHQFVEFLQLAETPEAVDAACARCLSEEECEAALDGVVGQLVGRWVNDVCAYPLVICYVAIEHGPVETMSSP